MASRSGTVGVVRRLGHAEDVVEDLAGVGEERRAEARGCRARCPTRRTASAVEIGTPGVHRRRPAGEQRGGVEEGERRVDDVVGGELGDAGDVGAGATDAALRAAHRLGQPGRPGREDEQEEVLVGRRRRRRRRSTAAASSALVEAGVVDHEHPLGGHRRVATPSSRPAQVARGDERLAVGVVDQLGQLLAAVGRVDADHDGARQRPGDQPEAGSRARCRAGRRRAAAGRGRAARRRARPAASPPSTSSR